MGPHGALGPGALGPGLLGPQGLWDPGTLGPWDPGTGPLGTPGTLGPWDPLETIPKSIVSNNSKRGGGWGGPAETFLISPIYFSRLIYKYFSAGLKLSH